MAEDAVRIGFVPLVDCALLAVAQEQGFFTRHNLTVDLRKAQSWAQVRDKLLAGEWDAAHSLITMPLQFALAAGSAPTPVIYAFTLSRNGNGIILANSLWNAGVRDGTGLSAWLANNPGRVLRLGVVFPRGTQEYFLRSWLARGGLGLGERISLTIIPPQEMVGRLRKGDIEGFCAGEPWSRRAAASKLGRLVAESGGLLPGLGEKVLAVRRDWHRGHTLEHSRLIRALFQASTWMADPANAAATLEIVASKRYVNAPKSVVEDALGDHAFRRSPSAESDQRFRDDLANIPYRSHAEWYLEQFLRCGHTDAASVRALDLSTVCLDGFHHSALSGITGAQPSPAPTVRA